MFLADDLLSKRIKRVADLYSGRLYFAEEGRES
jgi:hypothetical protein